MTPPELDELRRAIDQVDQRILQLIVERIRLVLAVGEVKRERGLPVHDPEREHRLLERLAAEAAAPLDGPTVRRIFERIIDEARRIEGEHVDGSGTAH